MRVILPALLCLCVLSAGSIRVVADTLPASVLHNTEQSDEHIVWIKTPIRFVVPVGRQRMLSFPDRVQVVSSDAALTTDNISILNNNGTLYIQAKKAFAPALLQVRLLASDAVIMVYVSGVKNAADNHALDVVVPALSPPAYQGGSGEDAQKPTFTTNAVTLTRVVAQQFYLPRLATLPQAVARTPMGTRKEVALYNDASVEAFPLASWRAGDLYATAVEIKNTTPRAVILDPRKLVGHWRSAAFFRKDAMRTLTDPVVPFNTLTPQGTPRDMTLLIVVSGQPFGQALAATAPYVRRAVP